MLTYGRRIPLPELDYRIEVIILKMLALYNHQLLQQVSAKTIRDVATKYLWDQCPAVVAIGE